MPIEELRRLLELRKAENAERERLIKEIEAEEQKAAALKQKMAMYIPPAKADTSIQLKK